MPIRISKSCPRSFIPSFGTGALGNTGRKLNEQVPPREHSEQLAIAPEVQPMVAPGSGGFHNNYSLHECYSCVAIATVIADGFVQGKLYFSIGYRLNTIPLAMLTSITVATDTGASYRPVTKRARTTCIVPCTPTAKKRNCAPAG